MTHRQRVREVTPRRLVPAEEELRHARLEVGDGEEVVERDGAVEQGDGLVVLAADGVNERHVEDDLGRVGDVLQGVLDGVSRLLDREEVPAGRDEMRKRDSPRSGRAPRRGRRPRTP